MHDEHPSEGALRSYLDGELVALGRWRCSRHLRRCPECRAVLAREREAARRTAALLGRLHPVVDSVERWQRIRAVSLRPPRGARTRLAAGACVAGAALALSVIVLQRGRGEPGAGSDARLQDLCCWDLDGGGPGDDGVLTLTLPGERVLGLAVYEDGNASRTLTDRDPIRYGSLEVIPALRRGEMTGLTGGWVQGLARGARRVAPVIVRDFCCADYDGGGPIDDGVLTVNRPGQVVERVVLYEDRDESRSFSAGDLVRWSTPAP